MKIEYLIAGGAAVVVIALAAWLLVLSPQPVQPIKPTATPQPLAAQIILLTASQCPDCADAAAAGSQIKKFLGTATNEKTIDSASAEGRKLVVQYNITKVPTVLVLSDPVQEEALKARFGTVMESRGGGAFVLANPKPPYFSIKDGVKAGIIRPIYLNDPSCPYCTDVHNFTNELKIIGILFGTSDSMDYDSFEGKKLVAKYGIKNVPTVIFSSDVSAYPSIDEALRSLGEFKQDGAWVLTDLNPPYRILAENKVVGLTEYIYILNSKCDDCYPPSLHRSVIERRFGITPVSEAEYDYNSTVGRKYVEKYGITLIPTIIISPDAKYYPAFNASWLSLGTRESDGWYVFRNFDRFPMVNYYNLSSSKVIYADNASNTTTSIISVPIGNLTTGVRVI